MVLARPLIAYAVLRGLKRGLLGPPLTLDEILRDVWTNPRARYAMRRMELDVQALWRELAPGTTVAYRGDPPTWPADV